ncbi:MAG: C40 family peptidase [Pseudobutyrivibrio sp.]|nr:C40 family peptidase [Pseudobutyrivibrio sp.]
MSNQAQKEAIKKSYAARKRHQAEEAAGKGTGSLITKASEKAKQAGTAIADFVKENPKLCLIIAVIGLLILFISCMFNACSMSAQMLTTPMVASSYTAQDDDILAVEANYTAKETDLRNRLSRIETDYPDYDEYRYELAEIGHDPYQLASYLTAVIEDYTLGEAASYLNTLFEKQYKLTLTPVTEIRYRTVTKWHWVTYYREETRTGYRWEGGKLVPYTYTVEVPYEVYESYQVVESYEYYILKVKLTNTGLDAVIRSSGLTDDQLERYGILLQTKGNKSYLFEDSIYANQSDYLDYDIPGEALTDRAFSNMIREAEKYLGYPYVWGGSSPSTSFDCSGFVSYVINNCGNGWNVGRQTANGLKNTCSIIRPEEAKPGDLIFFQGTYDTAGASHVGIYVGNNMMIHCGNPISYAHTDTSYWQSHFYCYGRLP